MVEKIPKNNHITKIVEKNKQTFVKLYDIVLWPIVQPIISHLELEIQNNLCKEIRSLFLSLLTQEKNQRSIEREIEKLIPKSEKALISED